MEKLIRVEIIIVTESTKKGLGAAETGGGGAG